MPLVAPMAELEARMHAAVAERTANAVVERDVGPAFTARLDVRDRDAFEVATVGTHTLRYLAGIDTPLVKGDEITIAGVIYRVIDRPQRLNAHELTADLAIV